MAGNQGYRPLKEIHTHPAKLVRRAVEIPISYITYSD